MPEELWKEICNTVQETVNKTIPKKKKCTKAKWMSEEILQIAEERRQVKSKGERVRCTQLNAEFQRIARRDKKAFLINSTKKWRKAIEWERLEVSSRKLELTKGIFHARMGIIRDRNIKDLTEARDSEVTRIQRRTVKKKKKKVLMTRINMMVWSLT